MLTRKIALKKWLILALLTAAPTSSSIAAEYVYGAWVGPKHGVLVHAFPGFFEDVKKDTNGSVTWKMIAGGQLVNGRGSLAGLRDGLIDGAFIIPAFTPKNMPAINLIYSRIVLGDDVIAAGGAANEAVMLHCPQCIEDLKKNNAVFLGGYMTTPFSLICREPVRTVADLKGKKVRIAAGGATLFKMADAVPVAMTPSEATTALQRGALDCVWGSTSWLRSFGYKDIAKYVTEYPLGMHGPVMPGTINRSKWNKMSDAEKQAHLKHAPTFSAKATILGYIRQDEKVKAAVKPTGVTFISGGEDFGKWMESYNKVDRETNIKNAKAQGVKNPEQILDAYETALEKWKKLSPEIGLDPDKYAQALKREIYDKVDPNKM